MIGVIIQARTGSTRYPRKIYEDISGKNTLCRVLEGVKKAEVPNKIILAMPKYDEQEFINTFSSGVFADGLDDRFEMYFGSEDDLVDRYFQAAKKYNVDLIVRVTADCPLIQGRIIDEMLIEYLKNGYNCFMGNNGLISEMPHPYGVDIEIFPLWMLAETKQLTNDKSYREHVTPFMYRRGTEYTIQSFYNRKPNTMISTKFDDLSFDTHQDLQLIKAVVEEYDKHGDLDQAIRDTDFEVLEWKKKDNK